MTNPLDGFEIETATLTSPGDATKELPTTVHTNGQFGIIQTDKDTQWGEGFTLIHMGSKDFISPYVCGTIEDAARLARALQRMNVDWSTEFDAHPHETRAEITALLNTYTDRESTAPENAGAEALEELVKMLSAKKEEGTSEFKRELKLLVAKASADAVCRQDMEGLFNMVETLAVATGFMNSIIKTEYNIRKLS